MGSWTRHARERALEEIGRRREGATSTRRRARHSRAHATRRPHGHARAGGARALLGHLPGGDGSRGRRQVQQVPPARARDQVAGTSRAPGRRWRVDNHGRLTCRWVNRVCASESAELVNS